jgi:hypothetical protein
LNAEAEKQTLFELQEDEFADKISYIILPALGAYIYIYIYIYI